MCRRREGGARRRARQTKSVVVVGGGLRSCCTHTHTRACVRGPACGCPLKPKVAPRMCVCEKAKRGGDIERVWRSKCIFRAPLPLGQNLFFVFLGVAVEKSGVETHRTAARAARGAARPKQSGAALVVLVQTQQVAPRCRKEETTYKRRKRVAKRKTNKTKWATPPSDYRAARGSAWRVCARRSGATTHALSLFPHSAKMGQKRGGERD